MTTTDAVKVPQPRPATGKVKALEQTVLASPTKLVRVIGTSNLATLSGVQTVDSVALKLGDVVLLTAQTTTHQNRLWTVMQGTWIAPLIADHPEKLAAGTKVTAQEGTANAGKTYRLTTTGTIVLGTTALTWTLDGSSGSGTVTSVTGTSPVQVATGTTTPVISVDAATTTASGIVELATTAETITGSDTVRAVTPAGAAGTYATLAGTVNLIDNAGDDTVGTADNTLGKLAKGSALQYRRMNAGANGQEWATLAITSADITDGTITAADVDFDLILANQVFS